MNIGAAKPALAFPPARALPRKMNVCCKARSNRVQPLEFKHKLDRSFPIGLQFYVFALASLDLGPLQRAQFFCPVSSCPGSERVPHHDREPPRQDEDEVKSDIMTLVLRIARQP